MLSVILRMYPPPMLYHTRPQPMPVGHILCLEGSGATAYSPGEETVFIFLFYVISAVLTFFFFKFCPCFLLSPFFSSCGDRNIEL